MNLREIVRFISRDTCCCHVLCIYNSVYVACFLLTLKSCVTEIKNCTTSDETPPLYSASGLLGPLLSGYEILTAVVMKGSVLWDITPCTPLKVNRRFEGTCRLHLQGRKVSHARNQREAELYLPHASRWLLVLFGAEDGGGMSLRNISRPSTDSSAISQYRPFQTILVICFIDLLISC
jgi:hypothetical protein